MWRLLVSNKHYGLAFSYYITARPSDGLPITISFFLAKYVYDCIRQTPDSGQHIIYYRLFLFFKSNVYRRVSDKSNLYSQRVVEYTTFRIGSDSEEKTNLRLLDDMNFKLTRGCGAAWSLHRDPRAPGQSRARQTTSTVAIKNSTRGARAMLSKHEHLCSEVQLLARIYPNLLCEFKYILKFISPYLWSRIKLDLMSNTIHNTCPV